jgi:hypothetical protein
MLNSKLQSELFVIMVFSFLHLGARSGQGIGVCKRVESLSCGDIVHIDQLVSVKVSHICASVLGLVFLLKVSTFLNSF